MDQKENKYKLYWKYCKLVLKQLAYLPQAQTILVNEYCGTESCISFVSQIPKEMETFMHQYNQATFRLFFKF